MIKPDEKIEPFDYSLIFRRGLIPMKPKTDDPVTGKDSSQLKKAHPDFHPKLLGFERYYQERPSFSFVTRPEDPAVLFLYRNSSSFPTIRLSLTRTTT